MSRRTRSLVPILVVTLVLSVVTVVTATSAFAAGTVLFQNTFADKTVDGIGTVTVPTPASGTNVACLTATGNSGTPPLSSCSTGGNDGQGKGKLRLTPANTSQIGGVFAQNSILPANGLDVTFNSYQWGGSGADGIAFLLAAVDPNNPVPPTGIGSSGGALGYSAAPGLAGLSDAYLGVGLDVNGNFSSSTYQGSGCGTVPNFGSQAPGTVAVRGPGNGTVGYCGLATTYDGTTGSKLTLRASTRSGSAVPVEVLINPTSSSYTASSGVSVAAGAYKVAFTPVGGSQKTLTGSLPTVASGLYPSGWLNTSGIPKQLVFGFVGSTGAATDTHEISDVNATTFNPVPQLSVASTAYSASTSKAGDPVNYQVTTGVLAGTDETSPVSVTQTVPAGVTPLGAFGTGWTCQPPSGQSITCTTNASSFANGTTLPTVTVVAVVTSSSNLSSGTIQSGSTAAAFSADANPATDVGASAGTQPSAPNGVSVSPTTGSTAGGGLVTVTATTTVSPTAIEIGTTAELQAGTAIVLLPCPSGRAAGCFNIEGSNLVIASMPARASTGTVNVDVVTLGIDNSTTYTYASAPATPAAPTATAGITSATVSWTAPAGNGSTITSYVLTPFLNGIAQPAQTFDASTTTRTLTGLTPAASYTFTVAAVNGFGTSAASPQSTAVVPYAVPGAPTITAVSAGDLSATLTWTAPANNGRPITAYIVTPLLGGVAQPTQTFTSTTGTVTGLTAGSSYTFTVAAQNLAGTGPASAQSAAVIPNRSPSLDFTAPPAGEVSVSYSQQLTVTDGTAPFTWSVTSGSLPPGLTLGSATGLLAGTPATAGSFSFVVQVTDASGQSATKAVTLTIAATPTVAFTPPSGEVGVAYSAQPTVTGGTAPITWAVTAGSLPAGLTLNTTTGRVSGTPTASGTSTFVIAATDGFQKTATTSVSVVVVAKPALPGTPPPSGQVGVAYSYPFAVTGGQAPLTWSISAGSPPAGLSFNAGNGVLSGTPTTAGSSTFTVSVVDANGQAATSTVTLLITAGPLVVTKTADVSSATAGSVVRYTITVANTGSTAFTGVALADPLTGVLDDATYNGNATASTGTVSYTSPTLSWTGDVAAQGSVVINYSVTVNNPDTGNKILANTVTSTTLGTNCPAGGTDTRCSATVTVPGLAIVQTADANTTTPGSTVHFSIVVTNTGQTAYPSATLSDDLAGVLDDAVFSVDGTATSGTVSVTGSVLNWAGALAVGGTVTITFSVVVRSPDPGDRTMTATVSSALPGSPCPAGNPGASCTASVTVLVPALSITDTANVSTTTPGGTVNFTVTIANTGQTPYTGTTVSLAMANALDDAGYDNDAAATAGTVTFDQNTSSLRWTGDLAVGAVVTVTMSMTVLNPDTGERLVTTTASSPAQGSTCPVGSTNPNCTANVTVLIPRLTVTVASDVGSTTPGSVVHYTVTVTDSGQTPYTGATVTGSLSGVLDDAAYDNDASATSGSVGVAAGTLTWTGDLAVGATATITYSVAVANPDTGDRTLNTNVTSTAPGSTCAGGGCANSVAVLVPGLDIAVTSDANGTTTTPTTVIQYQVTAHNTGQTTYSGLAVAIDLSAAVDDAAYGGASVTAGTLTLGTDNVAHWTLNLAPGATGTASVTLTVRNPDTGDRTLRVSAVADTPGSTCPTGSTNASCARSLTVLIPGLTITKTASTSTVTPGGTVGYTISVVNTGQATFSAATVSDDLSHVLTDAVYAGNATATTGTISYTAPALTWQGTLAPNASATITYSVTVRDPDPGDKRLVNSAVSNALGSNCPTSSSDSRCTATVAILVPGLTMTTSAGTTTTTPGATVGYTVSLTNSGQTAYTGATVTDSLTGVLDDADYNGDAGATAGTVTLTGNTLSWTGDLAVGASASITFSVTVHTANTGDNLVTNTIASAAPGSTCPTGSSASPCAVTVPVARLVLTQAYTQSTSTPGSVVRLNATFSNTGQVPYTGITVLSPTAGTLDDATPNGDQTASSGTLALTPTVITWTGNIAVGGSVTVTGTLTVNNPDTGDRILTGTLVSAAPGNNCPAGGSDSRCTARLDVLVPALTITKTADTTATAPGGTVDYTITVTDSGQTPYTGATVTDPLAGVLDDATYDGDAAATTGTVTVTAGTLAWTGDLGVGAAATITYSVTAGNAASGDKILVNKVTSAATGSTCPVSTTNPACASRVVVLTPLLNIVATVDHPNATLGTTVHYTISATNAGQVPFSAATFTESLADILDDAAYNDDATATSGTVGVTDGTLTWSGALAPGDSTTITYTVTINNPATGDGTMITTVTASGMGGECAAGSDDPGCTTKVVITNATSLTFDKTADVTSTVAGGVVDYSVTVTNSTDSDIDANFTDALSDLLDDATYDGDATATAGTVTFDGSNLTWTGTVPAGGTVTVTYSVRANDTLAGDETLTDTVTSTSLPESDNCLAGSTDPRCVTAVPFAALLIQQSYAETSTTPGSVIRLTATFTNAGAVPYDDISVAAPATDTFDDAVPNGDQTASSGTLFVTSTGVLWTGDIPVGGTVTLTGTLTVNDPDPGDQVITGTLESTAPGNNCAPGSTDPLCTATVDVLTPGLTITKTADAVAVVTGDTVNYTVTVADTGQTPYPGATVTDDLDGLLDDATYDGDATATTGTVTAADGTLTWTGDLATGETAVIAYSVTVLDPDTGDKSLVNDVSSTDVGSTCPPASSNPACRSLVAVLTPGLTIVAAADTPTALPGMTVHYAITATNSGQVPYLPATFTVPLGDILDDATYPGDAAATAGTVSLDGSDLTWTGPLAVGADVTVSLSVVVDQPVTGDFVLADTVTSPTMGSDCAAGSTDPRCATNVPIASLSISNSVDATTAEPTSDVGSTVTITNVGQVPYTGASITDDLTGSLDDATYDGDGSATSGNLTLGTGGALDWIGDVPVGGAVTITGSVDVDNPDLGDHVLRTLVTTDTPGGNCQTANPGGECATSVTVLTPELTITKAASTSTTTPGSTVGYTITVANTGQTPYTGAVVTDSLATVLDDGAYGDDGVATSGTVGYAEPVLTWTGDVAVGQTVVITYSVRVDDPELADRIMDNTALSDELGSTCPTGAPEPACFTRVDVLVPELDVDVASATTTTVPGGEVDYTVTVTNSGQTDYVGAAVVTSLAGVLDDASYAGDAAATVGTVAFTSPDLVWRGDLAADQAAVITYHVTVDNPDPGDLVLTTSATSAVPGSTCLPSSPCADTVPVLIPALAIDTTAESDTATPGEVVDFTVTVTDTGETGYPDATVQTALGGSLDDAAFNGDDTASSGRVDYTAPTLTWTGSLSPGDTVAITYSMTVLDPDPGDLVMTATASSPAAGSTCPSVGGSPECTATVTVLVPALSIVTSADTPTTTPGATVGYTVVITDTGQTPYTGTVVSDSLADALSDADYNGDATVVGGGTLDYTSPTLTWTGDLAIGATVTITYSFTVHDPDTGDRLFDNTVTSSEPGSTCPPSGPLPQCSAEVQVLVPGLTITKTADTSTVAAGDQVHYTVTVEDTGETPYAPATFTDSLADVLDVSTYDGDAVASGGSVQFVDGTVVWTGPLDVGATATISYSVTTDFPPTGDLSLINSITSGSAGANCVPGSGDPDCTSTVTVLVPALDVTKTADTDQTVAGAAVHYTIAATNTGAAAYPTATLTDSLAAVLTSATYDDDATATTGSVSVVDGTLSWTGSLAVGESVVVTYSVTTSADLTSDVVLTNRVVTTATNSDCPADGTDPRCTASVAVAALTIGLTGVTPSFTLTGPPDSVVSADGAVVMTVTTNNPSGYVVSVQAATPVLAGSAPGNGSGTIPIDQLTVRETGASDFQPLSADTPTPVHAQDTASSPDGDAISNDFRIRMPFVASDTYSATLDYVANTQ